MDNGARKEGSREKDPGADKDVQQCSLSQPTRTCPQKYFQPSGFVIIKAGCPVLYMLYSVHVIHDNNYHV